MKTKVIFLGLCGVLYSDRTEYAYGARPLPAQPSTWDKFDPVAIDLLKKAVRETGAAIVLSSEWRSSANLDALEWRLGIRFDGATRPAREYDSRGQQVADWLNQYPEVNRYAILDDSTDVLPLQACHLVRTSTRNGFLISHCEALIALLGRE
ncbi:hypothetical protein KPP23_071 [Pseudomonas phage KPP23]|nr:hypothetical protein KPP23_071 [Pseudomonas phage KPP23]